MNKSYITKLHNFTISLLKDGNRRKPLWMLAKWNCSEVTRIVGLKIMDDLGIESKPFILKGNVTVTGLRNDNFHDILGYFDTESGKYFLLDPTIWQFYPRKRSINLGSFITIESAIKFATKYYEGTWELSEYVNRELEKELVDFYGIIKLNCSQSPNWKE